MLARKWKGALLWIPLAAGSIPAQELNRDFPAFDCEPCVIVFDTVAIIRSTDSMPLTGTSIFERVGSYFALADLLEGNRVFIFDSSGHLTGSFSRRDSGDGPVEFGRIQGLQAVEEDSIAVFDSQRRERSVLGLNGGAGSTSVLPIGISPGGALLQDGFTVLSTALQEELGRMIISGPGGIRTIPMGKGHGDSFDNLRLLAHGTIGTFWVLHFLSYRIQQFDLGNGEILEEITRSPSWMHDHPDAETEDWRYTSLLGGFQPDSGHLWVLGRSNEFEYSYEPPEKDEGYTPLAGREAAWDLELELIGLPGGEVIASMTLPYWVGGFTSDGLLFFFDELESNWGQFVVVRLGVKEE